MKINKLYTMKNNSEQKPSKLFGRYMTGYMKKIVI